MDYSRVHWETFGVSVLNVLWAFQELEAACLLAWTEERLTEAGLGWVSLGSRKTMGTLSRT